MHAAIQVNIPNYASAIVNTAEIVERLCATPAIKPVPAT
jgi:hypothetical protein